MRKSTMTIGVVALSIPLLGGAALAAAHSVSSTPPPAFISHFDDHGTDDPATHDLNDDHGTDDPATHDLNDDHGGNSGSGSSDDSGSDHSGSSSHG